jgi:hypothetical protein
MKVTTTCAVLVTLLAVSSGVLASGSATASVEAANRIVTIMRHGGLCVTGTECRATLQITDTKISGAGYVPRRLKASERAALLRAIRMLNLASIRAHPFTGTCPVAYDGTESIYRFRGFSKPLASCTYDLRGVRAVTLTERLLATLKPR